jgi:hypothetical protein
VILAIAEDVLSALYGQTTVRSVVSVKDEKPYSAGGSVWFPKTEVYVIHFSQKPTQQITMYLFLELEPVYEYRPYSSICSL